jgi:50S ribosomal subunit-associated GTPase HflX
MDEMSDITKTAGYEVAGQVTQRRDAVDPAYCIGEGKLDEVAKVISCT